MPQNGVAVERAAHAMFAKSGRTYHNTAYDSICIQRRETIRERRKIMEERDAYIRRKSLTVRQIEKDPFVKQLNKQFNQISEEIRVLDSVL